MTLANDLDLHTTRCASMRCAFIPNMGLRTKLAQEKEENVKFSLQVCVGGQSHISKTICLKRGHKKCCEKTKKCWFPAFSFSPQCFKRTFPNSNLS